MATDNKKAIEQKDQAFKELEALFGQPESELEKMEKISLTQNQEGFPSCFPTWDLHPPKRN